MYAARDFVGLVQWHPQTLNGEKKSNMYAARDLDFVHFKNDHSTHGVFKNIFLGTYADLIEFP